MISDRASGSRWGAAAYPRDLSAVIIFVIFPLKSYQIQPECFSNKNSFVISSKCIKGVSELSRELHAAICLVETATFRAATSVGSPVLHSRDAIITKICNNFIETGDVSYSS